MCLLLSASIAFELLNTSLHLGLYFDTKMVNLSHLKTFLAKLAFAGSGFSPDCLLSNFKVHTCCIFIQLVSCQRSVIQLTSDFKCISKVE